jgi:hypothetical protein
MNGPLTLTLEDTAGARRQVNGGSPDDGAGSGSDRLPEYGVPVAGAADTPALRAANELVGNAPGAAALECTVSGSGLVARRPVVASVTGADLGAVVERSDIGRWEVRLYRLVGLSTCPVSTRG